MAATKSMTKWISVKDKLPKDGKLVHVHQLWNWAVLNGGKWFGVDHCGNRRPMSWTPEYWYPFRPQKLPGPPNA